MVQARLYKVLALPEYEDFSPFIVATPRNAAELSQLYQNLAHQQYSIPSTYYDMPIDHDSLPASLHLTQRASLNGGDEECPICQALFEDDSLTITHVGTSENLGCGRRFDEECLSRWLNS